MRVARPAALGATLAFAVLVLAACGSDDNSGSGSGASSAVPGGASGTIPTFEGAGFTCAEGSLRSSGSTAQGKVMEQWIADFNALCNATLNPYAGGGSGKGVQDFLANQVDFAGSDSALSAEQLTTARSGRCGGNDALNLPMVTGPLAVAYNLPGVDALTLTPETIAQIFNGAVTTWNAPAIAASNDGVALPDLAIQSVHRADDSGTTDNFVQYLKAAAPQEWPFPTGKSWVAPGGVAGQGNDGVGKEVQNTTGTVGYVEWGFALDAGLSIAKIDNGGGAVELTAESAGKSVEAARLVGDGNDLTIKIDYATKVPGAYPIVLVTYQLVCSAGNGTLGPLLRSFLGYTATDGQTYLTELGAAPLPESLQEKVIAAVKSIG